MTKCKADDVVKKEEVYKTLRLSKAWKSGAENNASYRLWTEGGNLVELVSSAVAITVLGFFLLCSSPTLNDRPQSQEVAICVLEDDIWTG